MPNTVTITACDNELYLVAYQGNASYELAHIQSGYNKKVNVTVNIASSERYSEPQTIIGIFDDLNVTYTVYLPKGTYTLLAAGIDWGVAEAFKVALNGAPLSAPLTAGPGVVWTPNGVPFTVT